MKTEYLVFKKKIYFPVNIVHIKMINLYGNSSMISRISGWIPYLKKGRGYLCRYPVHAYISPSPFIIRLNLFGREVSLQFSSLQDPPIVRPNYFSEPEDVATLVEAVKTSVKWGQSEPFKKFGSTFYDKPLDACSKVT
jgi:hypothetical protein